MRLFVFGLLFLIWSDVSLAKTEITGAQFYLISGDRVAHFGVSRRAGDSWLEVRDSAGQVQSKKISEKDRKFLAAEIEATQKGKEKSANCPRRYFELTTLRKPSSAAQRVCIDSETPKAKHFKRLLLELTLLAQKKDRTL